ncbi:MAG: SUMF1/EgtB/PvdO family nonheme iron enzyme [Xenococcaceae cyanobacterium]
MSKRIYLENLSALFKDIANQPTAKLSKLAEMAKLSLDKDYIGADLSDEDLSEDNLSGANFSNANLSNTQLMNTNLSNANLSQVDLREANLQGACLENTNLSEANLSNVNFREANLSGVNLRSADLSGADLSGADLSGADLRDIKTDNKTKLDDKWFKGKIIAHRRPKIKEATTRKILILSANPQGIAQLRLNPEIREITEALDRSVNRDQFVLNVRVAVRVEDLQKSIRRTRARIVHFCGHGIGSQGLVFETSSTVTQNVSTSALGDLFRQFSHQVECVVLNACYSEDQALEINQHIDYVIGTRQKIRDDAAIFFSTGFYEALFDGETIEQAYEFGCNRIQLEIYGSNSRERQLVPIYLKEDRNSWIELPQQEVLVLLKKEHLNQIESEPEAETNPPPISQLISTFAHNLCRWILNSQFQKRYYRRLIYDYRDYITQGLRTRGPFTLDLEKIFVPLRVSPESLDKISSEIIPTILGGSSFSIWDFLVASRTENAFRSIVIFGAPGSGKTTLLRHLTLIYAQNSQREYKTNAPQLIPVLLYLRDVAETIYSSPPTLAELLEQQESIARLNPPLNWFEEKLSQNSCLVMLDGLDKVADINKRQAISGWLDEQIRNYPRAIFLLTSRPFGYLNAPLKRIRTILEVKPFNLRQMEQFIYSWYLQTEIAWTLGTDNPGVRQEAQKQAKDLIECITNHLPLASMALNPLLLTMIATIHSYRGVLPGRRVELYAEICDVLLGRRQDAKGISDSLSADQKKIVLQVLALELMQQGRQEFSLEQEESFLKIISESLDEVKSSIIEPLDFLEDVEKKSGLLVVREEGVYQFAHLSFQEYLAAVEIKTTNQEQILIDNISNPWWEETIRLYVAQSNGTSLISAALEENNVAALRLALDCAEEGLRIEPSVRQQVELRIEEGLESLNPEIFQLAAEVILARRLSKFLRIDENRAIDSNYITCAEYQLFVDEWLNSGERFQAGSAREPITGISWENAIGFCAWLSQRNQSIYSYRLPTVTEAQKYPASEDERLTSWVLGAISPIEKGIRVLKTLIPSLFEYRVVTINTQGRETNQEFCYAQYTTENLTSNISLEMAYIPGESFLLGSPEEEGHERERPQHQVTVQPFFLSKYPVTQAQWRAIASLPKVMIDIQPNPSHFSGDELPVEQVSWDDAVEFCQRLSLQTGRKYRLPTEAEWEYACRAGTTTPFHFGETITGELANYRASNTYSDEPPGRNLEQTTPVESFPPNAFGLYDMHGNIWEWCEDDWHNDYQGAPTDGSAWLSGNANTKVLRGGSWINIPNNCRSAYRLELNAGDRIFFIGFRVVCDTF